MPGILVNRKLGMDSRPVSYSVSAYSSIKVTEMADDLHYGCCLISRILDIGSNECDYALILMATNQL